ncbi:unnamed protein product, partial [Brassica rapa]
MRQGNGEIVEERVVSPCSTTDLPSARRFLVPRRLPEYTVELEPIEEIMHNSKASHPALHEHLRPSIRAEEAAGFHKRVKRIHVLVKIVVPCTVFEVEFPIPPDRSVHLGSYNGVFYDHMYALASHRGLRFGGEIDKGPIEVASIDTSTSSSTVDAYQSRRSLK